MSIESGFCLGSSQELERRYGLRGKIKCLPALPRPQALVKFVVIWNLASPSNLCRFSHFLWSMLLPNSTQIMKNNYSNYFTYGCVIIDTRQNHHYFQGNMSICTKTQTWILHLSAFMDLYKNHVPQSIIAFFLKIKSAYHENQKIWSFIFHSLFRCL